MFAAFMAVQVTRGRQFRETWTDAVSEIGSLLVRATAAHASDDYFERRSADRVARGDSPLPPMTPELRAPLRDDPGIEVLPTKEHLVRTSFASVEKMAQIFFVMSWKLIRFSEPCLFTCDHPVSYWRESSEHDHLYGIGPLTAHEVRLPLSPEAMLIGVHPPAVGEQADAEHNGSEQIARCINRDLLSWPSAKQWLAHPDVAGHPLPASPRKTLEEWHRPWPLWGDTRSERIKGGHGSEVLALV